MIHSKSFRLFVELIDRGKTSMASYTNGFSMNQFKCEPQKASKCSMHFSKFSILLVLIFYESAFPFWKITILKPFAKIMFLLFSCVFTPEHYPKTPPKQGPNAQNIDAPNMMIFNIDFLVFWSSFWGVLWLQVRRTACSSSRLRSTCI